MSIDLFDFISGNFGNGVLSYFLFLKSLLFLNILIFFVEFCFVVIPQALYEYGHLVTKNTVSSTNSSSSFTCPAVNKNFYNNRSASDHILDFFTGQVCIYYLFSYEKLFFEFEKSRNVKKNEEGIFHDDSIWNLSRSLSRCRPALEITQHTSPIIMIVLTKIPAIIKESCRSSLMPFRPAEKQTYLLPTLAHTLLFATIFKWNLWLLHK